MLKVRVAQLAVWPHLRAMGALAFGAAVGYGVGMALVVFRLLEGEKERGLFGPHPYSAELLHSRYPAFDPTTFGDRADFLATAAGMWLACLLVILTAALAGGWAARRAWRALIPMKLRNTPPNDMPEVRAAWRYAVAESATRAWVLLVIGTGVGFTGAWVGEWSASFEYHLRQEAAWKRGAPQTAATPVAIAGPFGWADGAWVVGGTWLTAVLGAAIPARCRLRRTGVLAARWCPWCGYPAAPGGRRGDPIATGQRCSECGKSVTV